MTAHGSAQLLSRIRHRVDRGFVAIRATAPLRFRSLEQVAREAVVCHGALQRTTELSSLLNLIRELAPAVVLEVGTGSGGTLYAFARVATNDALLVSIDLPGGQFGGGYSEDQIRRIQSFARKGQWVRLLRCDSHESATRHRVAEILSDRQVDFLFIDGDHTYDGVKTDFYSYTSLVRSGGVIALHDIVPGPAENVGGVPRFWREIKGRLEFRELVESWHQGGYGIGVIRQT